MKDKTKKVIIDVLKATDELNPIDIQEKMNYRCHVLNYDPLSRHLKEMTEEGILKREARGKPWYFYYKLNKNKLEK